MPGRKNIRTSDDERYHEYRLRERIERGEKLVGHDADWLDRRGPAATAARRPDADRRRSKRFP